MPVIKLMTASIATMISSLSWSASFKESQKGGVTIRLVSGDNIDTAKAYAVDCGILSKEHLEQGFDNEDSLQYCMDSKQFRERIGGIIKDKSTSFMRPKN